MTALTPVAAVRRARFHPLVVDGVDDLTDDAVQVTFAVPELLRDDYGYAAGQHLTLRAEVGGAELRRSYSICAPVSAYADGRLRVAVKRLSGGAFSTWVHEHLRVGTVVEVMTPQGQFGAHAGGPASGHVVAVAAGSGITPVVSVVTVEGYRRLSDDEVGTVVDAVVAGRMLNPGGPQAPLR